MVKVTLKTIADEVGVSQMAVSAVLRGKGRVSDETRKLVLDTAERLGYRPNLHATSMRHGRNNIVGLMLSDRPGRSHLYDRLIAGILDEVDRQQQQLILRKMSDTDLTDEAKLTTFFKTWLADGMMVYYTHGFPEAFQDYLDRYHIPCIWINSKREHNCVYFDDFAASKNVTEKLIQSGAKRIVYGDFNTRPPSQQHYHQLERWSGYAEAMTEHGLKPCMINDGPVAETERFAFCREWFSKNGFPDALIGRSPKDVTAAVSAALSIDPEAVPAKMQAIGFTTEPLTHTGREISSLMVPMLEIGELATRMLLDRINENGGDISSKAVSLIANQGSTLRIKL